MSTTPRTRPPGVLSDADTRELATLRRRAYGPAADLDTAGQVRLRTLEDRMLDATTDPEALEPDEPHQPDEPPAPVATAIPADPEPAPAAAPSAAPLLRHPVLAVVGAFVVGVLLVVAGYTLARLPTTDATYLGRVAPSANGVATLIAAAPFTARGLEPDTLVQYEGLGDATFWTASEPDGTRCLLMTVPIDGIELAANGGVYTAACAPGGLAPSLDWTVLLGYPSPPNLPVGSIVRLTVDGDRLRVAVGRAAEEATPTP